jgi:acetate---CoA ligase (ADP-forming) subunit alpha
VKETAASRIIADAAASGGRALSEIESKQILEALGIPTATTEAARTAEEAAATAARLGFPAVLKVLSPDAVHKSDVGGVALNLGSVAEVKAAFARIRDSLSARAPGARFEGVAVEPMAPAGLELSAGIARDERFGALVMVGFGGVLIEVLKDTALRLAPIDAAEARAMILELRGAELLRGVRGGRPVDLNALAAMVAKLSEFAAATPEVAEMDLNPVVAYPDGLIVLDARIRVTPRPAAPAPDAHKAARLENLRRAFEAETVAVIGDKRMNDYLWLRALNRFRGKLYSVQIDPNEIAGIEAMGVENKKSLSDIPARIDYAISAVPRQVAPRILKDCVAHGVGAIGFFTSGFSETGEETGIRLERELREIARDSDIALVGPNCMGLYSPARGLCNFPDEPVGEAGPVSFISQSGTHTINLCIQAAARGVQVGRAASVGNVIVLTAADYLDLFAADPTTRIIGMYIEGARDGRRFFESVRRVAARIPVLIWKGGVTEAGARATFSHTGALATAGAVWEATMRQSGAVGVASLDEMLDAVELLARGRPVQGRRMGLVAITGGQSVVLTDTFAGAGLEVPALSAASYEELGQFFNIVGGSYRNPLDAGGTIAGGLHLPNLDRILSILDRDPVIDAIVLEIATGLRGARWAERTQELVMILDRLGEFAGRSAKPFAVILHPAHVETVVARAKALARERGLVVFESFERAAAAFRVAAECHEARARLSVRPPTASA